MKLDNIKEQVGFCLEHYKGTRNCDIKLMIRVWLEFYPNQLELRSSGYHINVEQLYSLPREDSIKRFRAYYQNEQKLYPPTTWEVAKRRGWIEREWNKALGYSVEDPNQGLLNFHDKYVAK